MSMYFIFSLKLAPEAPQTLEQFILLYSFNKHVPIFNSLPEMSSRDSTESRIFFCTYQCSLFHKPLEGSMNFQNILQAVSM